MEATPQRRTDRLLSAALTVAVGLGVLAFFVKDLVSGLVQLDHTVHRQALVPVAMVALVCCGLPRPRPARSTSGTSGG